MSQPAWIYARYSTAEQSKGRSLKRQLEEGRKYLAGKKDWEHSEDRELTDKGRSAFHGSNRATGSELWEFEQKALAGHFKNGAVLAVENLDRLTRQGYEAALDLIRALTGQGVTVAVWHDDDVFKAYERIEMPQVMKVVLKSELSREESVKKSGRLTDAWAAKIGAVQDGKRVAMTKMMPGWLTMVEGTREIVPIEHRAKVLNQIFDWYCDGKSLPWIVRALNEQREPTWGRGKHADANGWNVSTLHKYLTSRTVLGEYAPKGRTKENTKISKGFVVPDYYPQVIDPDKFNRVQLLRKERQQWGGRNQFSLPNLFSGIAMCGACGNRMIFAAQNKAGSTRYSKRADGSLRPYTEVHGRSYIRCGNAMRKHNCTNSKSHKYEVVEQATLDMLFEVAMNKTAFEPNAAVSLLVTRVAEQERQIEVKRQQLSTLMDNLMAVHSKAMAQRVAEIEEALEADEVTLGELRIALAHEKGSSQPEENLNAIFAVRQALTSEDEEERYSARVKTQQSLKLLIDQMICQRDGSTHISLRNSSVHLIIEYDGTKRGIFYQGPDGEDDWHPDDDTVAAE